MGNGGLGYIFQYPRIEAGVEGECRWRKSRGLSGLGRPSSSI